MAEEVRQAVTVPYTELAPDLLHAVVESYVLREGTDYGEREFSLAEKVAHVIGRLKRGEAQIVFDPETESVSIVSAP
ncbi:MAG: YheU family protein [Steroidobacteraceae bacterium]